MRKANFRKGATVSALVISSLLGASSLLAVSTATSGTAYAEGATVPHSYLVFFDFNKSNLTAEAQSVVAQAASTAKSTGMVKILVTGHTDTVGSHSYNQALSERRAAAVKDGLVSQGIDGAGISTVGKSFDDPLVPTGPNVREPQNRRAVIQLGEGSGT